jgi:DNA-binding NarL/FixJ family response regulator
MSQRIRVLIADDHPLARMGLVTLLQAQPDIQIVGQAGDGEEAVRQARLTLPDVTLLDVCMPVKDGLAALREIKQTLPDVRCLMLTGFDDAERVLRAIEAGADGFLVKQGGTEDLLRAIREIHRGAAVLDPAAARHLIGAYQGRPGTARGATALTSAELRVLRLLARGLSNRDLARDLGVSVRTITSHVQHILDKLGVQNRVEAALYARDHGLTA